MLFRSVSQSRYGVYSEIEQHNNASGVRLLDNQIASVNERFQTHTVVDNSVHKHLQKQIDEMRKNNNIKSSINTTIEIISVFLIIILTIIVMTYGGLHV